MALIEYDIDQDGTVTYSVLQVDKGDKIQYSSKYANAAVEFKGEYPFLDAPKEGQIIAIGKGKKGPFTVKEELTDKNKIQFECGEHTGVGGPLKPWKGNGGFIPPGNTDL